MTDFSKLFKPGDKLRVVGEVWAWREKGVCIGDVITISHFDSGRRAYFVGEWPDTIILDERCYNDGDIEFVVDGQAKAQYQSTIYDELYETYEDAITNELLYEFFETNVKCDNHLFMEELLNLLTQEQRQALVMSLLAIEAVPNT